MADVTVRGAGIFGLCVAWACLSRGARVQVIDPFGVAAGASGGVLGALAPHTPDNWNDKKQFQLDSLVRHAALWTEVDALSGLSSGYGRIGRLQVLADARAVDLAQQRAQGATDTWPAGTTWQVIDATAIAGDWAPPSPTGLLALDTLSARLHPRRACQSLAEAIRRRGGAILHEGADRGAVVWATGLDGLRQLGAEFGISAGSGVKGQAALLGHDAGDVPQLFIDGVHVVPHSDGTVAVGSTSENDYEDGHTVDARLEAMIDKLRASVPALSEAPVRERWAGLRPKAASRAPVLGAYPGRPATYIANGGFKIGFGMAPQAGEVLADLILEGRDRVPDAFRPQSLLKRG